MARRGCVQVTEAKCEGADPAVQPGSRREASIVARLPSIHREVKIEERSHTDTHTRLHRVQQTSRHKCFHQDPLLESGSVLGFSPKESISWPLLHFVCPERVQLFFLRLCKALDKCALQVRLREAIEAKS